MVERNIPQPKSNEVPLANGRVAKRVGDEVHLPDGRIVKRVGDEIKIYRPVPIEEALAVLETTDSTPNTGFLSTGAPSRRQLKGRRI